jgi:hypothetical protein
VARPVTGFRLVFHRHIDGLGGGVQEAGAENIRFATLGESFRSAAIHNDKTASALCPPRNQGRWVMLSMCLNLAPPSFSICTLSDRQVGVDNLKLI